MLSASQEIYSRRVRLVFSNRGKLFEGQYRAWGIRLLVNIDRHGFCVPWEDVPNWESTFEDRPRILLFRGVFLASRLHPGQNPYA
jgi:hypothetical protein